MASSWDPDPQGWSSCGVAVGDGGLLRGRGACSGWGCLSERQQGSGWWGDPAAAPARGKGASYLAGRGAGPCGVRGPALTSPEESGRRRECPHGVKSRCCLLAVIPSGENTRGAPDMQEEAQAQGQTDGRHPRSTLSWAALAPQALGSGCGVSAPDNALAAQSWPSGVWARALKRRGSRRRRAHRAPAVRIAVWVLWLF